MATTAEYLNKLVVQKNALADNLTTKGVTATHDETLETLVPKVLEISGGSTDSAIYPIGADSRPTGDVVISDGITSLYKYVFYDNKNVTSVSLPHSLTMLNSNAFGDCINLANVTTKGQELSFGYGVFENNKSLTNESCNALCQNIGEQDVGNSSVGMFGGCTSLTDVVVDWCSHYMFENCLNLKKLKITNTKNKIGTGSNICYNCTALTDVVLPENTDLATINTNAFYNCSSLININIPEGITIIDDLAFYNCGFSSISLPSTLKTIYGGSGSSKGTFRDCKKLSTLSLPESVTKVDGYSFNGCTSLTEIYFPANITSYATTALYGCTALKTVTVGNGWINALNLSYSDNITVDCIKTIIDNVATVSISTKITLSATVYQNFTLDNEYADYLALATSKGWSIGT